MPGIENDMREALSQSCCQVHQEVIHTAEAFLERLRRKVYVTPKSFLDLIDLYLRTSEEIEEKERGEKEKEDDPEKEIDELLKACSSGASS